MECHLIPELVRTIMFLLFGYGGYCLPKDSKELALVYRNIPASLIPTIVRANEIRKEYIATRIINIIESKNVQDPVIGIYRVNMKRNSDNCRKAAILDIISFLSNRNYSILIYEPLLNEISGCKVMMTSDLESLKKLVILSSQIESQKKLLMLLRKYIQGILINEKDIDNIWYQTGSHKNVSSSIGIKKERQAGC